MAKVLYQAGDVTVTKKKKKKEEQAQAAKTAEQKRNELREKQGLPASTNVSKTAPSAPAQGAGSSGAKPVIQPYEEWRENQAQAYDPIITSYEDWRKKQEQSYSPVVGYAPTGEKAKEKADKKAAEKKTPDVTATRARTQKKAAYLERQMQGQQQDTVTGTAKTGAPEYVWDIPAAAPKGSAAMQGENWMDYAAQNAKSDNVRVYVIKGVRVTEDELRAQGYSEEVLEALRGYGKVAQGITHQQKQYDFMQSAYPESFKQKEEKAHAAWTTPEEQKHRASHNTLIQQQHSKLAADLGPWDNAKVYDDAAWALMRGDRDTAFTTLSQYADELYKKQYYEKNKDVKEIYRKDYESAYENYLTALLKYGSVADVDAAIRQMTGELTAAQEAADATSAIQTVAGVIPKGALQKDEIAALTAQIQKLNQVKNAMETAALLKKVQENGDGALLKKLDTSMGTVVSDFISDALNYSDPQDASFGIDMIPGTTDASRTVADWEKQEDIEREVKARGYTDQDIANYSRYLREKDKEDTFGPYLKWLQEHPAAGALVAGAVQATTTAGRALSRLVSTPAAVFDGKYADYGKLHTDVVKQGTQIAVGNIQQKHPGKFGEALGQVYQWTNSAAESAFNMATLGPATSVFMGMAAAADSYDEALTNGYSREQAATLGLMSGVFEALFEYLSIDKIHALNSTRLPGWKGWAAMLAKSSFTEGTEEMFTDIAQMGFEYLYTGGLQQYNEAIALGYTPAQAAKQIANQVMMDGIGGAFSGALMGATSQVMQQGMGSIFDRVSSRATGDKILTTGDVNEVISAAKESKDAKTRKLGAKLEASVKEGKGNKRLAGQTYKSVQAKSVADAAENAYRAVSAERGVEVNEQELLAVRTAAEQITTQGQITDPGTAEVVKSGIAHEIVEQLSLQSEEWAEETAKKVRDFSRATGAYDDARGRQQINDKAVAGRAADVTKAVRGDNSYTLVKDGVEGHFDGADGAAVQLGGTTGLDEQGRMTLVTDYQQGADVQATAPFSRDGGEGTVRSTSSDYNSLLADLQKHMNGEESGGYGTAYQSKAPVKMSAAAANTAMVNYSPRANQNAEAYSAWFWDAYKAGMRGMSWEMYLSLYNQRGAGEWTEYISARQLQEAFRVGAMEYNPGVGVTRIGTMQLTKKMQADLDIIDFVARKMGFSMIAADDIAGKNGYVSSRADVAVISLSSEEGRLMTASFHELYHLIRREMGTAAGRKFISAVLNEYRSAVGKDQYHDDYIDTKKKYESETSGLTEEEIEWLVKEEMAAQYFGNLAEENIEHIVAQLETDGEQKMLGKVREFLQKFKDAIREAFARLAGRDPAAAAAMRTEVENAQRVIDMFIEAAKQTETSREQRLAEQGETISKQAEDVNFGQIENAETQGTTASLRTEPDIVNQERSGETITLSLQSYDTSGRDMIRDYFVTQYGEQDADDMMRPIDGIYNAMRSIEQEHPELTVFSQWSNTDILLDDEGHPIFTTSIKNGDYKLNQDFSRVCKKRRQLDFVLNMLAEDENFRAEYLTKSDFVKINKAIKAHGFEIACNLCFVDAKRFRQTEWANSFADTWNDILNSVANGQTMSAFNFATESANVNDEGISIDMNAPVSFRKWEDGKAKETRRYKSLSDLIANEGNNQVKAMARIIRDNPAMRHQFRAADIIASQGFDTVQRLAPEIRKLLDGWGGTSVPKPSSNDAVYDNSILNIAGYNKEAAYAMGGVRMNSFSDFMVHMFFDYCQAFADLNAKQLPMQSYSKELIFARLFGRLGGKINLSGIPAVRQNALPINGGKNITAEQAKKNREIEKQFAGLDITRILKKTGKTAQTLTQKELLDNLDLAEYLWADESIDMIKATLLQSGILYDKLTAVQQRECYDAILQGNYEYAHSIAGAENVDREYAKHVGTIVVGVSDAHVVKLLRDNTIRMVIPYHKSGLNQQIADAMRIGAYFDYTAYQNTRIKIKGKKGKPSGINGKAMQEQYGIRDFNFYDYFGKTIDGVFYDGKATAAKYLEWCRNGEYDADVGAFVYRTKNGYITAEELHKTAEILPKFDRFSAEENYYKLLEDFDVYDTITGEHSPQGAVQSLDMLPADYKDVLLNKDDPASLVGEQKTHDRFRDALNNEGLRDEIIDIAKKGNAYRPTVRDWTDTHTTIEQNARVNGGKYDIPNGIGEKITASAKVDFSYQEMIQQPDLQGNINTRTVQTKNGVVDVKWLVGEIQKQCQSVYVGKSTTPTYYLPCDDLESNIEISTSGLTHGLIKSQTGRISPSEQEHAKILLDIKDTIKNAIEVNRSNRLNSADSTGASILLGISALTNGTTTDLYAVKFVVEHRKNQAPVLVDMDVLTKLYSVNTKKIDPAMLRQKGITLTNSGRFKVSVADLIDLVKDDFDDIFSNDVYSHFNMQRAVTKDTPYLLYSRKTDAALTTDRIDYMIDDSGAGSRTDYARSWITSINPSDFINLTTKDFSDRSKFDAMPNDYGTAMDDYDYMTELKRNMRQTPYLAVDLKTGEIVGHEGRHRMRALEREGVTSTPVRIEFRDEDGYLVKEMNGYGNPLNTISSFDLKNQYGTDFTASITNIIPLMKATRDEVISAYGQEDADIRWSKKSQTAEERFDEVVAENAELKEALGETRKVLKDAQKKLDKKTFDAWIAGIETNGGVRSKADIAKVVKKYNDPKLTGMSHEELTDKILGAMMDLRDHDYAADELVEVIWGAMFDKARYAEQTLENEERDIIREITNGVKYVVSDQEFNELVEMAGSRRELNGVYRRVYGFTLVPQSEAERRGASVSFDSGMQDVAEALPNLFSDTNGSVADMAATLYELQDSMMPQRFSAKERKGLGKNGLNPDSDEAQDAYQTLYEIAYQEAMEMADDLIRLSPVHTVADKYARKMDELKQAYRGRLDARAKEIQSLRGKVQRRDARLEAVRNDRDEKLAAQRKYYREMRQRQMVKRQDTANKARLRKKLVKDVKWLRERMESPTDQKHIPEIMRSVVTPFLQAFAENEAQLSGGMQVFNRNNIDDLLTFYRRLNDQNKKNDEYSEELGSLYGLYDEDIEADLEMLKTTLDGKRLSMLTAEELQALDEVVSNLCHLARDINEVFVNGRYERFSQSGTRLMEETVNKKRTNNPVLKLLRDKVNVNMAKPVYMFREMIGGEMRKYFDDIRYAQEDWAFKIQDAHQALEDIRDKYQYKDWSGKDNNITVTLHDGTSVLLTKEAVMQIYATYKREQSLIVPSHHLTEGGIVLSDDLQKMQTFRNLRKAKNKTEQQITESAALIDKTARPLDADDLRTIFDTLTEQQRGYVDAVVGFLTGPVAEWGNAASMQQYGYKKFGIGNSYYFPFQSSDLYLRQSIGVTDDARIKNKGFTKALTKGANNPVVITGFSDVAAKHISDMASYSTLLTPLENMNRILNYKEDRSHSVKAEFENTYGAAVNKYVSEFLKQMNGGVKTDAVEGLVNSMVGRFKRAAVALNASVVVQQPSAIARAMSMVNPIYFVASTGRLLEYKELKQYSGVAFIKELGGWDTETGRSVTSYLTDQQTVNDRITEWTGKLAEWADAITWSQIWHAVKLETAAKMNLDYKGRGQMSDEFYRAAAERFNEVVEYTQVYDSTLSRSQLMRSQGAFMKMATAFMAEPTTTYNMLVYSGQHKNGRTINKGAALGAWVFNVVLNTALQSLVGAWRDKDDISYFERWFRKTISGVFGTRENLFTDSDLFIVNMIPIAKDIISFMQGYDVGRSDMQPLEDIWKRAKAVYEAYMERDDEQAIFDWAKQNYEVLLELGVTLSNLTPLPLKSLYRDAWKGIGNAIQDAKDGGYITTAEHIADIWRQNFQGQWDNNERMYRAITTRDEAYLRQFMQPTDEEVAKYINTANDEFAAREHARNQKMKTFHEKAQEALKAMDPRVEEAARLRLAYDLTGVDKLIDEMALKGGFDRDDVVKAINEVANTLKGPTAYDDQEPDAPYLVTKKDIKDIYESGGSPEKATAVRDYLHGMGESDKDIDESVQTPILNDFVGGELTVSEAIKAFNDFTTYNADEIAKKLTDKVAVRYKADDRMTYDDARNMYRELGMADEKIAERLGKLVTADYDSGKFGSKDEAVSAYMRQTGEKDEDKASIRFDYYELKGENEDYPLDYSEYAKYVSSGLQAQGVTPTQYSDYKQAISKIDGSTTSDGWVRYKAGGGKLTANQYHICQVIDSTFATVAQKDAAWYAQGWATKNLSRAPWH